MAVRLTAAPGWLLLSAACLAGTGCASNSRPLFSFRSDPSSLSRWYWLCEQLRWSAIDLSGVGKPHVLSAYGVDPAVAVSRDGSAVIAWVEVGRELANGANEVKVRVVARRSGGSFGRPQTLTTTRSTGANPYGLDVEMAADGSPLVAFADPLASKGVRSVTLWRAVSGHRFGPGRVVGRNLGASDLQVSVSPGGAVIVGWGTQRVVDGHPSRYDTYVATLTGADAAPLTTRIDRSSIAGIPDGALSLSTALNGQTLVAWTGPQRLADPARDADAAGNLIQDVKTATIDANGHVGAPQTLATGAICGGVIAFDATFAGTWITQRESHYYAATGSDGAALHPIDLGLAAVPNAPKPRFDSPPAGITTARDQAATAFTVRTPTNDPRDRLVLTRIPSSSLAHGWAHATALLTGDDRDVTNYVRASGSFASISEGESLRGIFGTQSASTGAVIAKAVEQRIPLVEIDQSNRDQVLGQLTLAPAVVDQIWQAVAGGNTDTTPTQPVSIGPWNGAGYIVNGERSADFCISGGRSGGDGLLPEPGAPVPWGKWSIATWLAAKTGLNGQIMACTGLAIDVVTTTAAIGAAPTMLALAATLTGVVPLALPLGALFFLVLAYVVMLTLFALNANSIYADVEGCVDGPN